MSAYASSECSDEPAHPRKIVSALICKLPTYTWKERRWWIRFIYRLSIVHSLLNYFTMDGFSYYENWKTLRWSRHIRICFPYHTSVDVRIPTFLYETNEVASACAPHSLINKNIKHFVGPDLGPNCQLLLSAADKVSRTAWCLRSKPPLLLLACGGLGFAHKTWLPSRGRGPTLTTFFLVDDGIQTPQKRAIIGLPAKHR